MERLTKFLKNAFSYPQLLYATHPVTTVSMLAATVLFAVYTTVEAARGFGSSGFYMDLFWALCVSVVFFAVFSLCIESIRARMKQPVKIAVYVLFGLFSLFWGFVISDVSSGSHRALFNFLANCRDCMGSTSIFIYVFSLIALSILLAMYFSYSHDVGQKFNTHILNIYSKVFFTSIIYGVIQLGVIFLVLIFSLLLYDDAFRYLPTILILINGLFYIPAMVYAATHENEDANTFMQVIVRYVSLVITLMAFVIIYVYMIKLVVTTSVPSNSVYAILTALFIVSMFISYMSTSFEEDGPLQKYAYNCPLIFAPFILMQCYTVFVRIGQYGLTPKRYFGIAFILFEIVYIVYYTVIRKREKEIAGRNILLIMCMFLIVCVFVPGISAKSLSDLLAKHTISSYMEKVENGIGLSDEALLRADAAYDFLSDRGFGSGRATSAFPDLNSEKVKDLRSQAKFAKGRIRDKEHDIDYSETDSKYGYFATDLSAFSDGGYLEIGSYDRLVHVNISDGKNYNGDGNEVSDASKLKVYIYDDNREIQAEVAECPTVDLTDYCKEFIKNCEDEDSDIITPETFSSRCKDLSDIDINDNVRLLITNADIARNSSDEPVYVSLEGYMLIR